MTRRELIRRRLAPAVFIIGMAFLVQHTCMADQRRHATVELDFGEALATTRAVDAVVQSIGGAIDAEPIARFQRTALDGQRIGPCKFEVSMPDEMAELVVDVTLTTGHRLLRRTIQGVDGAIITVPLGTSLAQP